MNQRSRKLIKIFLSCVMGIIIFTGCSSTDAPTDPVVVEPTEPVDERSRIEILAENYDHLAWYLDESTTKTVDGLSYDLVALKQQYGDLYRFVEPLSKEEVEYRFQYLAEFFQIQVQDGSFEDYHGGIVSPSQKIYNEFFETREKYCENISTTTDQSLKKYSSHYYYSERMERYSIILGGTFDKILSDHEIINIIDQFSFEEKDWYVRKYMAETDMILNIMKENDEEPRFNFELEQRTR